MSGPWVADCHGLDTYNQVALWNEDTGESRVLVEMPEAEAATELWLAAERFAVAYAAHLNEAS